MADLARLRAAVAAEPKSEAFVALARRLCDEGVLEEAEGVCRKGLVFVPNSLDGKLELARVLANQGRAVEAESLYLEVLRASPDHGQAMRRLGALVLRRGDRGRARALLEYAEELLPGDGEIAQLLAAAGGEPGFTSKSPVDAPAKVEPTGDTKTLTPMPVSMVLDADRPAPVAGTLFASARKAQTPGVRDRLRARPRAFAMALVAVLAIGLVLVGVLRGHSGSPWDELAAPLDSALADGSLTALQAVNLRIGRASRDAGAGGPALVLANAAAVQTLLAAHWRLPTVEPGPLLERARAAIAHAEGDEPQTARAARVLAACEALDALAGGALDGAHERLSSASADEPPFVTWVAAHIAATRGRLPDALRLASADAAARAPALALLRTRLLLDDGRPGEAAALAEALAARVDADVRAALLAVELSRARGEADGDRLLRSLDDACAMAADAPAAAFACAVERAVRDRLAGERAHALKRASALLRGLGRGRGPQKSAAAARDLARLASLLVNLGEGERAARCLSLVERTGGAALPEARWARLGLAIGRGEGRDAEAPGLALSPDTRLIAVRARLAAQSHVAGPDGLDLPAPALAQDRDLAALVWLGETLVPAQGGAARLPFDRAQLERWARAGHPVAAYALARADSATGAATPAGRRATLGWLRLALGGHGDACPAARAYRALTAGARLPPAVAAALARVEAANPGCASTRP